MNRSRFLNRLVCSPAIAPQSNLSKSRLRTPSAVLIPLIDRDSELSVLFTLRASHLKHHPGQISFPGGKYEPSDKTLLRTALREAWEEIGLPQQNAQVIGQIPRYPTVTGFEITAVLAFIDPDYQPRLDANEVSDTFEVPLSYLLNRQHHHIETIVRDNTPHQVHCIRWQNKLIWGATAALIWALSVPYN